MIDEILFHEVLGPQRFLIWSKENEMWRTFYRTIIPGQWSIDDVEEFKKCQCIYEFHFDHSRNDDAQLFSLLVMQRCQNFKAAKVSKLAVNNMKVMIFLGHSPDYKNKINTLATKCSFDLPKIRARGEHESAVEKFTKTKFGEYMANLRKAFAPMAGRRFARDENPNWLG